MPTMPNKFVKNEPSFNAWKSDSARQRWQLFHRAIAHAKQSNTEAMQEAEQLQASGETDRENDDGSSRPDPLLSIAR